MGDVLSQEEIDAMLRGQDEEEEEEEVQEVQEIPESPPVADRLESTAKPMEEDGLNQRKLELILDIPVRSRVVIGKITRNLKELLDLKPGMIIETENAVSDHVELQVNGKIIALGEVVVVGEYYGLRVKRIVTPEERLEKLK